MEAHCHFYSISAELWQGSIPAEQEILLEMTAKRWRLLSNVIDNLVLTIFVNFLWLKQFVKLMQRCSDGLICMVEAVGSSDGLICMVEV